MFPIRRLSACLFFFNDTATTEIYTLSLHDALPICIFMQNWIDGPADAEKIKGALRSEEHTSELQSPYVISYAVFCLKKNNTQPYIFFRTQIIANACPATLVARA